MAEGPRRPDLTLPPAEAAVYLSAVTRATASGGTVLEYGSGGSTLLASEAGAEVWSVESDAAWAAMMRDWFEAHPPARRVTILHADIGPTRDWGHPVDDSRIRQWPDYALTPWETAGFPHPDVVLVDGRFRLASFLAVAFHITRPVTLFFDDYTPRRAYHRAEEVAKPAAITGRMARFDLTPTSIPPDGLRRFARASLQPG